MDGHDRGKSLTLEDLEGRDFATVREAAAILRINHRTIRSRIHSGLIPAVDLGYYRIPVRWLREQAQAEVAA